MGAGYGVLGFRGLGQQVWGVGILDLGEVG